MAKTYIPQQVRDVHTLAVYMARYNSVLRAAVVVIDPDFSVQYDALYAAVLAFDQIAQTLYPLEN